MQTRTEPLLHTIGQYWTRRAESYSEVVQYEMTHNNEANWMDVITHEIPRNKPMHVLDIGTGPGFFAIGLAKRGYAVTAVDYTQAMLNEAKHNAGIYRDSISFRRMDAHCLDFADGNFDAIVTRNLTWNLERPQDAYKEWFRVLKTGGVLLNFDAGWYSYLFDEKKAYEFEKDHQTVVEACVFDYNDYSESAAMEDISRKLILSRCQRPEIDIRMLHSAGFRNVSADRNIGEKVWDDVEKLNYKSTPLFLLRAER